MNTSHKTGDSSKKIDLFFSLSKELSQAAQLDEKKKVLHGFFTCADKLKDPFWFQSLQQIRLQGSPWEELAFLAILAIDQEEIVFQERAEMKKILSVLGTIERFYERLGGIVGYYTKILQMTMDGESAQRRKIARPPLFDVTKPSSELKKAISEGVRCLPKQAEIYPIGGLGDRLNLRDPSGEPTPAATLPFCGRSLLEGLIRDVQGREYLYFKLFSEQVLTPIALMTSLEKDNDRHVREICEKNGWFGRPQSLFFLFSQLSVPVVTKEGNFSMREKDKLNLHPAGHGALWRTAEEKGVYKWLQGLKRDFLLIRQINNPLAGIDHGLLSLLGKGVQEHKAFGFASCQRVPKAAEGLLVLTEKEDKTKGIVNIEYTDFAKFGIEDVGDAEGYSLFPTNTNILFADLAKLLPHIRENPLPGLVLNMKSDVPSINAQGEKSAVKGGRLESMMQSIAETLVSKEKDPLVTFVSYNERMKTISTTKRSYEEGKPLLETPQGAFYDLMRCAYDLLTKECGMKIPSLCSPEDYLLKGPSLLFLYHPALGPLYEIIRQKIRGGSMALGAELQLEIAEVELENLQLEGSLIITAEQVMGDCQEGILRYGDKSGKCSLIDVSVRNQGFGSSSEMLFWKNDHKRHESLNIKILGMGEFHAERVVFQGSHEFVVPDGERWTVHQEGEAIKVIKEKITEPTWRWQYRMIKEEVKLFSQKVARQVR